MRYNRILLIDSYDSFTFNLARLLTDAIPNADVQIIKNDSTLPSDLVTYSAVVVGPGPGTPSNPHDSGIIEQIWSQPLPIPVFGVCLGLQCLVHHFGGDLLQLGVVKHGQVSLLRHTGTDIFNGVGEVRAVRYHSLHVRLPSSSNSDIIIPLAWADDGHENDGLVLMAARHSSKPFWGVQYHPESICSSSEAGLKVVKNFWRMAEEWNNIHRNTPGLSSPLTPTISSFVPPMILPTQELPRHTVTSTSLPLSTLLPITRICELLGFQSPNSQHLLLDSASAPSIGRFSIIGIVTEFTPKILYSAGDATVTLQTGLEKKTLKLNGVDIWTWIAKYMADHGAVGGLDESPFWGGLIGYLTYEIGVTSLGVAISSFLEKRSSDIAFAFIHRSVVVDHLCNQLFIQSLLDQDELWLRTTSQLLTFAGDVAFTPSSTPPPSDPFPIYLHPKITMPDKYQYLSAIKEAQGYLAEGQSYELCLTALTKVSFDHSSPKKPDWELFKTLRQRNPAPFSSFLRLGDSTLIGSSPERFLSWTRSGKCQLRPIKGTVKKTPDMTFERARELLYTPKEIAENLMIVDLIRHDLHQLAGDTVEVSKLFEVEEYETVFQLVSVIEGQVDMERGYTGFDVLTKSLPPGSMTGAPKRRSVELLQVLEGGSERGLYSGVCGYWCAGGGGDFSVIIRSAFQGQGSDDWYLGAGGAITALSDPEEEWAEMETKLKSILQAFL